MRKKIRMEERAKDNIMNRRFNTAKYCAFCRKEKIDITQEAKDYIFYCVDCRKKLKEKLQK